MSYGTPAHKVRGKLIPRLNEDGKTLVCRTAWEEWARRLAIEPEKFCCACRQFAARGYLGALRGILCLITSSLESATMR